MSLCALTCADEEDVIVSVSSGYSVDSNLSEGVTGIHLYEERPPPSGQDWVVHERVVPRKLDDVVREVLGGTEGAKGLTRTLGKEERKASRDIGTGNMDCPLGM